MVTTVVLIVLNRINPDVHLSLVVLPVLPLVLHYVVVRRADRQRGPGSERSNIEPRRLHVSLALVAFSVAAVTIGSSIMVGVWLAATSSSWTANASAGGRRNVRPRHPGGDRALDSEPTRNRTLV
jgi:cytochrome c biogenesis protein CcdA